MGCGCLWRSRSTRWLRARNKAGTIPTGPVRDLSPAASSARSSASGSAPIPVVSTAANGNWLIPWTDHAVRAGLSAAERSEECQKSADPRSKARTQSFDQVGDLQESARWRHRAAAGPATLVLFDPVSALFASSHIFTRLDPLDRRFRSGPSSSASSALSISAGCHCSYRSCSRPRAIDRLGRVVQPRPRGRRIRRAVGVLPGLARGDYRASGLPAGSSTAVGMIIIWFARLQARRWRIDRGRRRPDRHRARRQRSRRFIRGGRRWSATIGDPSAYKRCHFGRASRRVVSGAVESARSL